MVKLGLRNSDVLDGKLCIGLRKPNFSCLGPEHPKLERDAGSYGRNGWKREEISVRYSQQFRGFVNI